MQRHIKCQVDYVKSYDIISLVIFLNDKSWLMRQKRTRLNIRPLGSFPLRGKVSGWLVGWLAETGELVVLICHRKEKICRRLCKELNAAVM